MTISKNDLIKVLEEQAEIMVEAISAEATNKDNTDLKKRFQILEDKMDYKLKPEIYRNWDLCEQVTDFVELKNGVFEKKLKMMEESLMSNYKPCAECHYKHKHEDGANITPEEDIYCSLNQEYTKDNRVEILACKEENFKSFYPNRSYDENVPLKLKIISTLKKDIQIRQNGLK